jgi:hypothetical protein
MGSKAPATSSSEEAVVLKLAEDLRTEASSKSVLKSIKLLFKCLNCPYRGDAVAARFLRADGLPALIRHIQGTATQSPTGCQDAIQSAVSEKATAALRALLRTSEAVRDQLGDMPGIMKPLIDTLCDASLEGRCAAAEALVALLVAERAHSAAMADAGVIGLTLSLYIDLLESPEGPILSKGPAMLVRGLVSSAKDAACDFEQAIRGPDSVQAFAALTILQVRHCCCVSSWSPG